MSCPSRSGYESWDGTFFPLTFQAFLPDAPARYRSGREPLELSEIHLRLADRLGLIPPIPDSLYAAAEENHAVFGMALMEYAIGRAAMKTLPFILGKTLGKAMGSVNLASLWGMLRSCPSLSTRMPSVPGIQPGLTLGEELFQQIIDHPEGIWMGQVDPENNLANSRRKTGKSSGDSGACSMGPENRCGKGRGGAEPRTRFPLVLMAGRHISMNANTLMRNPVWNEGKRDCTLPMHPTMPVLKLTDGQQVRVQPRLVRKD